MDDKLQVFTKGDMWHVRCPDHGDQTFPSRAEAEDRARVHGEEDGREWEVVEAPED